MRTIFAVQHDPNTRIGVTHEPGNDNIGKGLVVSLYRTGADKPQRFRYWNPMEVTQWFEQWSRDNVTAWRHAYHLSGLGAADFERPGGSTKDVQIEVSYRGIPYLSQRDNERYPTGTCNVTSYAMPMEFWGVTTIETRYHQTEDNLEYYMKQRGLSRHSHEHLAQMARAHGLDARFNINVSLHLIREELKSGTIVIVSGQFTSSGHIVCVIATKGCDFIVHDPWGDFNTRYRDHNGAFRTYTEATMQDVLVTKRAGRNPIWAHLVKGRS